MYRVNPPQARFKVYNTIYGHSPNTNDQYQSISMHQRASQTSGPGRYGIHSRKVERTAHSATISIPLWLVVISGAQVFYSLYSVSCNQYQTVICWFYHAQMYYITRGLCKITRGLCLKQILIAGLLSIFVFPTRYAFMLYVHVICGCLLKPATWLKYWFCSTPSHGHSIATVSIISIYFLLLLHWHYHCTIPSLS